MHDITKYRNLLEQRRGSLNKLKQQRGTYTSELEKLQAEAIYVDEATIFIQEVARKTQDQVKVHINDIVSLALATIFEDPYLFELEFVVRRNKTECDIYFIRNGQRINPLDESGGGAVDVASFASRIALWSIGTTDNVLVFDEPFKFVSREYQAKVGELLTLLSNKLNLQIIMVSHNDNFIQNADNIITIKKKQYSEVV
jgi:DNA repair exonuclease SbcCD ATPase subunit